MSWRMRIWIVIAVLCLLVACAQGEKSGESSTMPEPASPVEAAVELPTSAVLIGHRVADYDVWKQQFDEEMPARKEAGCLGHYLKRGIDDPDMVYIYCLADDAEGLRAFLDSAELAEAMQGAGVQGEVEINLMQPMSRDLVAQQMLPGIIVMHEVEDYDRWREAYDNFDDFRRSNGIVGHAVSRRLDNPNRVVVYHQANDVEALRSFVDSTELAEGMQSAGVVGAPDIRFIQVVDFARY